MAANSSSLVRLLVSFLAGALAVSLFPLQSTFQKFALKSPSSQFSSIQITDMHPDYVLPPLPYTYDALEPYISKEIMQLHHGQHHAAYVKNLNAALKSLAAATDAAASSTSAIPETIFLQSAIKFNGGGHINHSLFWKNLCPASDAAAQFSAASKLAERIRRIWGSEEAFKAEFNKILLGIQGSGWGWLVKVEGVKEGELKIVTTKDQDPIVGKGEVPIFGVDMWEHAYYLQYKNVKADYVKGIWNVINWRVAEERYLGGTEDAFKVLKASM